MTDVLHWLPVTYHVQYTAPLLVSRAQQGQAPKYVFNLYFGADLVEHWKPGRHEEPLRNKGRDRSKDGF